MTSFCLKILHNGSHIFLCREHGGERDLILNAVHVTGNNFKDTFPGTTGVSIYFIRLMFTSNELYGLSEVTDTFLWEKLKIWNIMSIFSVF